MHESRGLGDVYKRQARSQWEVDLEGPRARVCPHETHTVSHRCQLTTLLWLFEDAIAQFKPHFTHLQQAVCRSERQARLGPQLQSRASSQGG